MPDALIFDFDGVVVDSEPIHLAGFRAVLQNRGISLSKEDYYDKYVGYDDHDCFAHVLEDNGREVDEREIAAMTAEKTVLVKAALRESVKPMPGVLDLMRSARAAGIAVGICSGALREEIVLAGNVVGALELADVLVSAEDVSRGKPDPEGYLLALRLLGDRRGRPVDPARSYVVEDAPAGVQAARAAGCRVIAVTSSYNRRELTAADVIVDSLEEVRLEELG